MKVVAIGLGTLLLVGFLIIVYSWCVVAGNEDRKAEQELEKWFDEQR